MGTGQGNYLTKQTGEYLVAAALCRRGYIATTFTGNVPHYDILAVDQEGRHVLVQVKTISGDSWQMDAGQFAAISFDGHRQIVHGVLDEPYRDLICVLVQLECGTDRVGDKYFVLPWKALAEIVTNHHREVLRKHDGIRPKKWDSLHLAFKAAAVADWAERWDVLTPRLHRLPAVGTLE